jgi:thiol-disulfide isomerase/thioredoxin
MIRAGKAKNNKTHKKRDKKLHKKTYIKKNNKQQHINKQVTVGLVHANWCGHCQHLMPEWNKMEHNIKNDQKLNKKCDIVKIDSEHVNNELPKYENMINQKIPVEGYPTIFLIKNKQIEKYGGERTAEALGGWVAGAVNGHVGGKKTIKTRKNSKKGCKSCKTLNLFKLW